MLGPRVRYGMPLPMCPMSVKENFIRGLTPRRITPHLPAQPFHVPPHKLLSPWPATHGPQHDINSPV